MDIQDKNTSTLGEQTVDKGDQKINHSGVCPNCGALLTDDQKFCHNCGKDINQQSYDSKNFTQREIVMTNYTKESNNGYSNALKRILKNSFFISIGGIISGIISVIFGFIILNKDVGSYELSCEYGGDAYTGIQNAAAQTANNIKHLSEIVRSGFAFLLIIIGLIAIFYFVWNLKKQDKYY